MFKFGRESWPKVGNLQARIERLLYGHLAGMFLQTSEYNRYWICGANYGYWKGRYQESEDAIGTGLTNWSGRKDMRAGDLVFLYGQAPIKAITDIYVVHDFPRFDPYGGWDGFWVNLSHLCAFPVHIGFTRMRADPVLKEWSVIKRQFQGVVTEPVPHACYNCLLTLLPENFRKQYELEPEPVSEFGASGDFATEEEFEDVIIEPLLKSWGLQFKRQFPCKCHFGTQQITGFVDFVVSNRAGLVTLFEDKLRIVSDEEL